MIKKEIPHLIGTNEGGDTTIQGYGSAYEATMSLEMLVPEDVVAPVPAEEVPVLLDEEEDEK